MDGTQLGDMKGGSLGLGGGGLGGELKLIRGERLKAAWQCLRSWPLLHSSASFSVDNPTHRHGYMCIPLHDLIFYLDLL